MQIDRHEKLEPRRWLRDYVNAGRPVIVSTACAHWPAMHKWSPAFLREQHGDAVVSYNGGQMKLSSVLDAVEASSPDAPSPYLIECYLHQYLPALVDDVHSIPLDRHNRSNFPLVPANKRGRRGNPELLVAGTGTRFPILHYDLQHLHAFITQVRGDKKFWLYPPSQTPYLYPRPDQPNLSRIDRFDEASLQHWPLHDKAQVTEVIVHEGETIFIPTGWWHRTQILSPSIALTWNAVSKANWAAYIEDRFIVWTRSSKLKTAIKQAYYGAVGQLLNLIERMRGVS